ncbi:MAG TPA: hypothetical protein VGH89_20045 [Pseudonocardia sp.]|jgi:hypothetical protein
MARPPLGAQNVCADPRVTAPVSSVQRATISGRSDELLGEAASSHRPNFMVEHLTTLLDRASAVPEVNQIEVQPYFQ